MSAKSNLLLQALPNPEREALASHLEQIELKQHNVLFDIRDAITDVYFAADAVVSLVIRCPPARLSRLQWSGAMA